MGKRAVLLRVCTLLGLITLLPSICSGSTLSYVGVLTSPDQPLELTVSLASAQMVTLQTFGFGGGVNGAGATIAPGGTDPFLAIFAGTGAGATMVTDGMGNPYGTSLDITNYGSFAGCPPAGAPVIGGSPVCADIYMSLLLPAGDYTVLLGDGLYIPYAVFDNGTLGEGFADFTAGNFCNLLINGVDCPNMSGAYALDITTADNPNPVPEPATFGLLGFGIALGLWRNRLHRVTI